MIQISGYEIKTKIHTGQNHVYQGIRTTDNKPVIIKVPGTELSNWQKSAKLRREFNIGKSFNSPNIIKYEELIDLDEYPVVITEDFNAISLRQFLDTTELDLRLFLHIAIQMAAALENIHKLNIIHRDIKPDNIAFNTNARLIKIIDFGIASKLSRETSFLVAPEKLEGTLSYMSPEQTGRMNRSVDYRTDFYALGATFYEMLVGRPPFQAAEPIEMVHCHIAKMPVPPREIRSAIPEALSQIILKMLAKTAELRYQSAFGLKHDLMHCLKQLGETGTIKSFNIAQKDYSDRFSIPQKLYGRQEQVAELFAAFDRACSEKNEILFIKGKSGIGKSALIHEVHKSMVSVGYFIAGKFDQFRRDLPYSAIIEAFQNLIRLLLGENPERIDLWKKDITAALGKNGKVVCEVIPDLELIIGVQPDVPVLGLTESQNRFNYVFQRFVSIFIQDPLVLFLDDLQWADSASIKLIETIVPLQDS